MVFQMLLCGECYENFFEHLERWIVCTPLSVNVFVRLVTQYQLKYHCEAPFETPSITTESQVES
jgi:hypothetical protein